MVKSSYSYIRSHVLDFSSSPFSHNIACIKIHYGIIYLHRTKPNLWTKKQLYTSILSYAYNIRILMSMHVQISLFLSCLHWIKRIWFLLDTHLNFPEILRQLWGSQSGEEWSIFPIVVGPLCSSFFPFRYPITRDGPLALCLWYNLSLYMFLCTISVLTFSRYCFKSFPKTHISRSKLKTMSS